MDVGETTLDLSYQNFFHNIRAEMDNSVMRNVILDLDPETKANVPENVRYLILDFQMKSREGGAYCRNFLLKFDTHRHNRSKVSARWIHDANKEIDELDDEMTADSLPQITATLKEEARRIVLALAGQPAVPTVYGTEDGDIAIQFDSEGSAVLIELSRVDGGAVCFSHVGGKNRRARYDDSKDLPDDFVRAQLRDLAGEL